MAKVQTTSHIHNAPAGANYKSVLDAGRTMLQQHYQGYLEGKSHALLPPIFVNTYVEETAADGSIEPGPNTNPKDKQLKGASINKRGEDFELLVFKYFERLLHDKDSSRFHDCHILWKGFTIDRYKMNALINDFPGVAPSVLKFRKKYTTKKGSTFGECDMVVLVKDVGLIVVEIKEPLSKLNKGVQQCNRMADFTSLLFETCAQNISIPVVKVVVLGEPPIKSSGVSVQPFIVKDPWLDTWILYEEATKTPKNFENCWSQVLDDLKQLKAASNAISSHFEDFSMMMTGYWSMVSFDTSVKCVGK